MTEILQQLPDDCWEIIFSFLDHHVHWQSVSLVCKQFLSITNHLRTSLKLFDPSIQPISRYLQRFTHLKKIDLSSFRGSLDLTLHEVAQSGLVLEELNVSINEELRIKSFNQLTGSSLRNLKILKCSSSSIKDEDLIIIADSFPSLEELNISNSCFPQRVDGKIIAVTDVGITELSSRLKRLRRINLDGNYCISDSSLISLSTNCVDLMEIVVGYSRKLTQDGVSFVLRNSQKLSSLTIAGEQINLLGMKVEVDCSRALSTLIFIRKEISDQLLHSITQANLPLKVLLLSNCSSYTVAGISSLLKHYQTLESLALDGAEFLTDESIEHLVQFMQNLTSIKLNLCPKLSISTFHTLAEGCIIFAI